MIKKLLICIASAFLFLGIAQAQESIAGEYKGTLTVKVVGLEENQVPNSSIFISDENDNKYTLSVKNFTYQGAIIGDLDVDGVERREDSGIIVLQKEGYSDGPTGLGVALRIYLINATILDEELQLQLDVRSYDEEDDKENSFVDVAFTGKKQISTGLVNRPADSLEIYLNGNSINVLGNETANYTIFSINGNMIEAGYIQNAQINIANIPTGVYFLQVGNKVAKFVK